MILGEFKPARNAVIFLLLISGLLYRPGMALAAECSLEALSAIMIDFDSGRVLYEQNPDTCIPPASLTKILSMYVALDMASRRGLDLDIPVTVSKRAANTGGSRMALAPRERVSLDNLLTGMAVSSGNDASMAVAEYFGQGYAPNFVSAMNSKARAIGMRNSLFANPHGLPAKGQRTTARDMLILSRAYLRDYPSALRYHSKRQIVHNGVVTYNRNPLLGQFAGADGLKTGWISASGYNLVSTARQGKTRLLAVILGCPSNSARAHEMHRLMEAGFMASRGQSSNVSSALASMPAELSGVSPVVTKRPKAFYAKVGKKVNKSSKGAKNIQMAKNNRPANKAVKAGKKGKNVHAAKQQLPPLHGAKSGISKHPAAASKNRNTQS